MSQPSEPPKTEPPRLQRWVWALLVGGVVALIFALSRAFPGAVQSGDDWSRVVYGAILLAVVVAGASRLTRANLGQHARNIAIWIGIVAILAVGYAYRDTFADAGQRLRIAFGGARPVVTGERSLTVTRDESGHFLVLGRVNGQPVRFLVDTGATDTVLSPADARRLGIDVDALNYGYESETANGTGYAAVETVDRLQVGPIRADNFRLMINKTPMSASLLGMSFLGDLESYQVRGDRLTLTWRGANQP